MLEFVKTPNKMKSRLARPPVLAQHESGQVRGPPSMQTVLLAGLFLSVVIVLWMIHDTQTSSDQKDRMEYLVKAVQTLTDEYRTSTVGIENRTKYLVKQKAAGIRSEPTSAGDRSEPFMPLGFIARNRTIAKEFLNTLWVGDDPMAYALTSNIDHGYPHTNIMTDMIAHILEIVRPVFWLEVGSMLGGSAIKVAQAVKQGKFDTSIVCIDPWTGDVNMWDWEKGLVEKGQWRFIRLQKGIPTLYDRFRANVVESGQADVVIPIVASSLVGMKLLSRLKSQHRISSMPEVIYLDSAHEEHETLMEMNLAWSLIPPGGVLWGDDYGWNAVQNDLKKFANSIGKEAVNIDFYSQIVKMLLNRRGITYCHQMTCIIIDNSQWIIPKKR
jgi:hypothetical protein